MAVSAEHIAQLIYRSLSGSGDDAPTAELAAWIEEDSRNAALVDRIHNDAAFRRAFEQRSPAALRALDRTLMDRIDARLLELGAPSNITSRGRVPFMRQWGWAAASVLLLVCVGAYLLTIHTNNIDISIAVVPTSDIQPGRHGAILTLADGSQVSLDTISAGTVALQGGVTARVLDGRLLYEGTSKDAVYNTMSTRKGRQYSLTLPDGTKVWLNAASSIRYPTVFEENERRVSITGEVYFDVARNAAAPFHVNVRDGASIAVLGTQFNVNAYENEGNINATLIEGSIRISVPSSDNSPRARQVVLQPGQQARIEPIAAGSGIKVSNDVDIEKAMAWKNGLFNFNGLTFEEIMRQLERWYDIKVVYEHNKVPSKRLIGEMTRDVPLDGLLKNLQELGVRYKLQDRTLIISP